MTRVRVDNLWGLPELSDPDKPHACKVCMSTHSLCGLQPLSTLGNIAFIHNPQHLLLISAFIHLIVVTTTHERGHSCEISS